ncbi:hypothetical protein PSPO01_00287, partial [Paraphaeosphaeria sporulosa]
AITADATRGAEAPIRSELEYNITTRRSLALHPLSLAAIDPLIDPSVKLVERCFTIQVPNPSRLSTYVPSMSFGFSPSDFVTLINLTRIAYKGWESACGEYADITSTLLSLQVVLKRVQRHVDQPITENVEPFLQAPGTLRDDLAEILRNSNRTVGELQTIVHKYPSLGRDRKSNWERLRLGCKQLDGLQIRLSRNLNLISTLLLDRVLLSIDLCHRDIHHISSKIQGGVPVALENIVESQASDARTASSTFTTYEHDSVEVWRELRREMVNLGFKSDDVLANKNDLLALARAISGDPTQEFQERSIAAASPPTAPLRTRPHQGGFSEQDQSQNHAGVATPSEALGPGRIPRSSLCHIDLHIETRDQMPTDPVIETDRRLADICIQQGHPANRRASITLKCPQIILINLKISTHSQI